MNLYLDSADEASIQEAIFDYLVMRGHLVIRVNAGATKLDEQEDGVGRFVRFVYYAALGFVAKTAGIADLIGCTREGRFFAVECKTAKGKASKAQLAFLRLVEERTGLALIGRSIEDVQEAGL